MGKAITQDGWMDGWMDGRMYGWREGRTDRVTYRVTCTRLETDLRGGGVKVSFLFRSKQG